MPASGACSTCCRWATSSGAWARSCPAGSDECWPLTHTDLVLPRLSTQSSFLNPQALGPPGVTFWFSKPATAGLHAGRESSMSAENGLGGCRTNYQLEEVTDHYSQVRLYSGVFKPCMFIIQQGALLPSGPFCSLSHSLWVVA